MKWKHLLLLLLAWPFCAYQGAEWGWAPAWFPQPVHDFRQHPPDSMAIQLGRALFYDPILSADSSISCASCHSSYQAFAHTDHAVSHGIGDSIGTRNAPALQNLAWQTSFMWDGSISQLRAQALAPLTHPKEMGGNLEDLLIKLRRDRRYLKWFAAAYQDSAIRASSLLDALTQFQLTLVSANSKYDLVVQRRAAFTAQEQKGYALFQRDCNQCHTEPLFTNGGFANNGLIPDKVFGDLGRYRVTLRPSDSFMFKIPTLRNLSFTFPYMHDGRYKKLQQVIQHYVGNKYVSTTLSQQVAKPFVLSDSDRVDLLAFLLTLNDRSFITNPDFQFPQEMLLKREGL